MSIIYGQSRLGHGHHHWSVGWVIQPCSHTGGAWSLHRGDRLLSGLAGTDDVGVTGTDDMVSSTQPLCDMMMRDMESSPSSTLDMLSNKLVATMSSLSHKMASDFKAHGAIMVAIVQQYFEDCVNRKCEQC